MTGLQAYVARAAGRQWQAGEHDCCTFPSGWVRTWGLGDPYRRWRGTYSTDAEALALIDRAGGLERLWRLGMSDIGVAEVSEPQPGDVGVIWVRGAAGPEKVGAIYVGPRWSALAPKGVFVTHAEHVACWGLRDG